MNTVFALDFAMLCIVPQQSTTTRAAATLWNSLNVRDRGNRVRGSPSLESFKINLKTLLFNPLLHAIRNNGIRFFPFGIAKKMYQIR